jgi:hypothetical protein
VGKALLDRRDEWLKLGPTPADQDGLELRAAAPGLNQPGDDGLAVLK